MTALEDARAALEAARQAGGPVNSDRYLVATDGPALVSSQPARLYRLTGYRSRAELAGQGTLGQMQTLCDELNREADR